MEVAVEVEGEVLAGEGEDDLVFESGIDREGTAGDKCCAVGLLLLVF